MSGIQGSEHSGDDSPEVATHDDLRLLILAPTSNDARLTAVFLRRANLSVEVCASMEELLGMLRRGCGALVLAEEALVGDSFELLVSQLESQPSWSDLPAILITGNGESARSRPKYLSALGSTGNVSLIERPVRPETLVSTCEVALRSRRRQYQVRDLVEQIRESRTRLNFALQSAQVGDWELDLASDISTRSLRHDQIFGYPAPVEQWGFEVFLQHVHPEDRVEVETRFRGALNGGEDWRFECRIIWPDGSVHWIAAHGSLYQDTEGNRKRMLGVVMDITAQKNLSRHCSIKPMHFVRRIGERMSSLQCLRMNCGTHWQPSQMPRLY